MILACLQPEAHVKPEFVLVGVFGFHDRRCHGHGAHRESMCVQGHQWGDALLDPFFMANGFAHHYDASALSGNKLSQPLRLTLLMPVYNDWQCAGLLLQKLDEELARAQISADVLIIDDGSAVSAEAFVVSSLRAIQKVESLRLHRNIGHQRAIAVGLCFLFDARSFDAVVVLDADGEDRAEDVPRLIHEFLQHSGDKVIFAERTRRSESFTFRFFYQAYRWLHRLLTGIAVKVGNFSVLSREHVKTLTVVSELWNHYAASIFKARLPMAMIPAARGQRLAGESKLNFVGLVIHGLSAISVFAEAVGVRLVLAISILVSLTLMLVAVVIALRLGTERAIPGWATSAVGLLLIIALQMFTLVVGLTFFVLFTRNSQTFLPARDYRHYVGEVRVLYGER